MRRWAHRVAVAASLCVGFAQSTDLALGQSGSLGATQTSSAPPTTRSGDDAAAIRFRMENHPTVRIGSFAEISIRARLESTVRTATPDEGRDAAEFNWQSQRLELQGTVFRRLEFEVSREFSDAEEPERDAFVNLRVSRALEVQAGRFKLPFGRDTLTGGANLDFIYRSLTGRQLSPGRDTGLMAHGRLFGRTMSYESGYFRRDGDNARTTQARGARDALAARILLTPFASKRNSRLAALQVGAAAVGSHLDNQLGLRGRTVFREGVFFDRVFVNGLRLRRGLEAAWALGSVSLAGEFTTVSDERNGMGLAGEALQSTRATGWYLAGTWALTGERKRGRIDPRRDFLRGGPGAIELAARVERLEFDAIGYPGTTFDFPTAASLLGNAEHVTTLGVAWYVNRYVKVQGNLVIEAVDDPQRSPAPGANGRFPSGVFLFQFVL